MQVTVDGFVSTGPNDEQKWVTWAWEEIKQEVLSRMDSTDTIIIGRKLAVDFIPYWQAVANDPKDAMYELAIHNVRVRKVIFSKTLKKADWHNTESWPSSTTPTKTRTIRPQKKNSNSSMRQMKF